MGRTQHHVQSVVVAENSFSMRMLPVGQGFAQDSFFLQRRAAYGPQALCCTLWGGTSVSKRRSPTSGGL